MKQQPLKKHSTILKQSLREITKLLLELEKNGKNLSEVRLRTFRKTHYKNCKCSKCFQANISNDPASRGLREIGFKVFFYEYDEEK